MTGWELAAYYLFGAVPLVLACSWGWYKKRIRIEANWDSVLQRHRRVLRGPWYFWFTSGSAVTLIAVFGVRFLAFLFF